MPSADSLPRRFPRTLPDGGAELSPRGGARSGSGRIKGKKTSDTIQITGTRQAQDSGQASGCGEATIAKRTQTSTAA